MNALPEVLASLLAPLAEHGMVLLLGVTIVLACGLFAMRSHRSIAQRRSLGVTTALAVVLYLAVAVAPLPRFSFASALGEVDDAPAPVASPATQAPSQLDGNTRAAVLAAAFDALAEGLDADGSRPRSQSPAEPGTGSALAAAARDNATMAPAAPRASTAGMASRSREPELAAAPGSTNVHGSLVFAGIYVLGVACMLVRTIGGRLRLRALLAACAPVPAALLRGIDLPAGARVATTARAVRPFCAGFWRPSIVLPAALLAPERAVQAHAVLRHEAAHVRTRDPRVWSLLAWLAIPLWFHPLFWWLCRDVRFCSEVLADDAAAGNAGRQRYAKALIDLAERSTATAVAAGTVAIFHRPSEFYRRIQMLLSRQAPLSTCTSRARRAAQGLSMLLLVGGAASVFGVPAPAQGQGNEPLRRENLELRATLDSLREELRQLRDEIAALQARSNQNAIDAQGRAPRENAGTGEKPKSSVRAKDPQPVDPAKSERLRRGLYDTRQKHMEDQMAEEQHIAGTPSIAPAVPEPEVENPGVPVLKDLPVIGDMFKPTPAPDAKHLDPSFPLAPAPNTPERREEVKTLDVVFGDLAERRRAGPPVTSAGRYYVVKAGDSLQRIARVELGNADRVREVMTYNPGLDWQRLAVGQQILLPDDEAVSRSRQDASRFVEVSRDERLWLDMSEKGQPAQQPAGNPSADDARIRELLQSKGFPAARQPQGDPALTPSSSGVAAIGELTARFLDLQAELEVQKATAGETKQLYDAGHASQSEALRAAVMLRTLEKKLAIATRLIDGEIAATESEMQWLQRRRTEGGPSEGMQIDTELRRAQTRLDALRAVKP